MKKYTSIGQFRNVIKYVNHCDCSYGIVLYSGQIKLHGTNAGIRFFEGKFIPQCRTRHLISDDDNMGFAKFVRLLPKNVLYDLFELAFPHFDRGDNSDYTIFGEWIGKGIQGENVAVGKLPRQFVVFNGWDNGKYIHLQYLRKAISLYNIYGIDCIPNCYKIDIDFREPENAIRFLEEITELVTNNCPWGKQFDVDGFGEGLVWRPIRPAHYNNTNLWFKTKGDKHNNKKSKIKIEIDPAVAENITKLVDIVLPISRLNQGLQHLKEENLDISMINIGTFLKWINLDIRKEEADVIITNNLEWKNIVQQITRKAKQFFKGKLLNVQHPSVQQTINAIEMIGGIRATAKALDLTTQGVRYWCKLSKWGVGHKHVVALSRLTNGRITPEMLRPDIFK